MREINIHDDLIDLRDLAEWAEDPDNDDERLRALVEELNDQVGDIWEHGNSFEPTLIADRYFKDYAMDLAEDLGAIPQEYSWPASYIDWEAAVRDLKMDYYSVEAAGFEFWIRA